MPLWKDTANTVLVTKAVETYGKGAVLATKAMETHRKVSVLPSSPQVRHRRRLLALRPPPSAPSHGESSRCLLRLPPPSPRQLLPAGPGKHCKHAAIRMTTLEAQHGLTTHPSMSDRRLSRSSISTVQLKTRNDTLSIVHIKSGSNRLPRIMAWIFNFQGQSLQDLLIAYWDSWVFHGRSSWSFMNPIFLRSSTSNSFRPITNSALSSSPSAGALPDVVLSDLYSHETSRIATCTNNRVYERVLDQILRMIFWGARARRESASRKSGRGTIRHGAIRHRLLQHGAHLLIKLSFKPSLPGLPGLPGLWSVADSVLLVFLVFVLVGSGFVGGGVNDLAAAQVDSAPVGDERLFELLGIHVVNFRILRQQRRTAVKKNTACK